MRGIFGPGPLVPRNYHYFATIENAEKTLEVLIVSESLDQAWIDAEQAYGSLFEVTRVRPDYLYNSSIGY